MKFSFVSALMAMFSILVGCTNDTIESSFKNYSEMEASGIFEKGWLPSYLPKSAKNIKEVHNLDSNLVFATFEFEPEDVTSIKSNCNLAEESKNKSTFSCSMGKQDATIVIFKNGKAEYRSSEK